MKAPDEIVRGFFIGGGNRELLAQVAHVLAPKISDGTPGVHWRSSKALCFQWFFRWSPAGIAQAKDELSEQNI
jgi:hypothetical protein